MADKYYITTPIYYPSGKWHIGTCYTTIISDAIARFKRMQGVDVFYLTGTDEHGQKIQKVAEEAGVPVKQYVDGVVDELKSLWKLLDISYDKFIRTTDEYHQKAVQKIFTKLYEQGDIYKSQYEGWYCTPCESYFTKTQLVDGKCPDCGRPVELMKEESYFFRMTKYQDRIVKLFEETPEFLLPASRRNEMINTFLKPGLQDICVSRTTFDWGVKVPFDPKHVVYVWIDALTNYITALGYGSDNEELFNKYWPADLHMMAKEIVRFHSITWPALLMALDLPLPKQLFAHGWLMFGEDKMSKSKGNVVDPFVLCEKYGVDSLRYYILSSVIFGQDGSYTNSQFLKLINSDLANDLGNLVSRVTAMVAQYFGGVMPNRGEQLPQDDELVAMCDSLYAKTAESMDKLMPQEAMDNIWKVIRRANKYIDETTPWALAKSEDGKQRLASVMYNLCEAIRFATVVMQPFLTQTPAKIFAKLGIVEDDLKTFASVAKFGAMSGGRIVEKGEALFARLDIDKEIEIMNGVIDKQMEEAKKAKGEEVKASSQSLKKDDEKVENVVDINQICIEDFERITLRVGTVLKCEKVPKADKLLCSSIDVGEQSPRTIVSGIAKWYSAEEMVGKQVIVVANLKPAKLRGIESQGMILCASDDEDNLCIVSPTKSIKSGSEVR